MESTIDDRQNDRCQPTSRRGKHSKDRANDNEGSLCIVWNARGFGFDFDNPNQPGNGRLSNAAK